MNKYPIKLTICITTFNRPLITSKLINQLPYYQELEYIIVDDGSDDSAFDILKQSVKNTKLPIQLLQKTNGGKLSAIRYALPFAKGQFFMDLDSDDGFTNEYLNNILKSLKEVLNRRKLGEDIIGTTGLCTNINNQVIGNQFPVFPYITNHLKMRLDDKIIGDKEEVILTEALKALTIPIFKNENRIPTSVQWYGLAEKKCLFVNKIFSKKNIYEVERISNNILSKIIKNKNGTRLHFKTIILQKSNYNSQYYFLEAIIQYIRFSFHGASPFVEKEIWQKYAFLFICLSPFSLLVYIWDCLYLFKSKCLWLRIK